MTEDPIVDTHQHFQDLQFGPYPWLDPGRPEGLEGDLSAIRRTFLPADYRALVAGHGVRKTVHVQNGWTSEDPVGETRWLAGLGLQEAPTAIVAYADLSRPDVGAVLYEHLQTPSVRGIRQILNWHEDPRLRVAPSPDLMQQDGWRRGFRALSDRGLSFDLQIYWPQMAMARELAEDFPTTTFVLNHFGMPIDRSAEGLRRWEAALSDLSRAENVAVKLSGYGLGHPEWTPADTVPLLSRALRLFTPHRTMFGSNLPVDLLFSDAARLFEALDATLAPFGPADRTLVRSATAERIYRI